MIAWYRAEHRRRREEEEGLINSAESIQIVEAFTDKPNLEVSAASVEETVE